MKKLDRYLISAVLKIYSAGQIGFFGIYIFIDLLDKAFKLQAPEGTSQVLFLGQYYLSQCPNLFQTTCPFIFSLSTLITLSRFQHNSQLVAINAAGLSTHRTVQVLLVTSLFLGGLVFSSQEWLNPTLTKWRLSNMSEDWNLKQQKHLNFRDQLDILEPTNEMKQLLIHTSAIVDIDQIFTGTSSGNGFHATFMDHLERPLAKLYAQGFEWDEQEVISLNQAIFLIYNDQARPHPIENKKIKLTIPIEKILLASKNLEALRLQELSYFTSNLEVYSESTYRLINPFFPFLMLLVSSVIALPFIFSKPIYGYFSSLGCSFCIFFMANYLKSEIVKGEVNATMLFASVFGTCFLLYAYRRSAIPT